MRASMRNAPGESEVENDKSMVEKIVPALFNAGVKVAVAKEIGGGLKDIGEGLSSDDDE